MVRDQQTDLLNQVMLEQVGPRDGCGVSTRLSDMAERQTAIGLGIARRGEADLGIKGADACVGLTVQNCIAEAFA